MQVKRPDVLDGRVDDPPLARKVLQGALLSALPPAGWN